MITSKDIQQRLREAIKSSDYSQKEIAELLNIHPTSVNKYMRENTFPSLETFANLCKIIDASADEILGLKD